MFFIEPMGRSAMSVSATVASNSGNIMSSIVG
jgi:hypothetical protein